MPRRVFDSTKHERNSAGRLVSKKRRALGKQNKWAAAVKRARAVLGVRGFMPVKKGTPLYKKARELYLSMQ